MTQSEKQEIASGVFLTRRFPSSHEGWSSHQRLSYISEYCASDFSSMHNNLIWNMIKMIANAGWFRPDLSDSGYIKSSYDDGLDSLDREEMSWD